MEGIRDILQINGYEVLTATNGVAGLEVLESQPIPPDLIVSDIMMPRMDGYDFFQRRPLGRKVGGDSVHLPHCQR